MTLVNYAYHASVTDGRDMLSKLRTFALAQSWTSAEYLTSVAWDSGWIAGGADWLTLSSTCYGSCDKAHYRFYIADFNATEQELWHSACTQASYSNIATDPWEQNRWSAYTDYHLSSLPTASYGIDHVWFFGNQYYIYIVAQIDDYLIPAWHMGTVDLYSEYQGRDDCAFWGSPNYMPFRLGGRPGSWDKRDPEYWMPGNLSSYHGYYGQTYTRYDFLYFSGEAQNPYNEGASYNWWVESTPGSTPHEVEYGAYNWCRRAPCVYGPNARRVAFKCDVFGVDNTLGQVVPLGKTPFYIIKFNGLAPGDTITENGYSYMCFPFRFTWMNFGFAFRIA